MKKITFVTSDPMNFRYVGLITEDMLARVSMDSEIIYICRKLPKFGERPISLAPHVGLDVVDILKRGGGKRKAKAVVESQTVKSKAPKKIQSNKVKLVVVIEVSKDDTFSDIRFNDDIQTVDVANTSNIPEQILEQFVQPETVKISTLVPTFENILVLNPIVTRTESDIYKLL